MSNIDVRCGNDRIRIRSGIGTLFDVVISTNIINTDVCSVDGRMRVRSSIGALTDVIISNNINIDVRSGDGRSFHSFH